MPIDLDMVDGMELFEGITRELLLVGNDVVETYARHIVEGNGQAWVAT
jgi:hypothetical protein